ncbi:hypothetical protein [Archangium lansingense]|uniref:Uncharacterized protein n=1 Tax=Archangium lansingense TaxID=2995310 RepID=A0ABT4AC34_9BACT|nr:hypothetical protein [Archangium lansinium]MCY1079231.1 hypothetical protein [Archangium lansinium]
MTNAGIESDVKTLLEDISSVTHQSSLAGDSAQWFKEIVEAFSQTFPTTTADAIFGFLTILSIQPEVGHSTNLNLNYFELADKILKLSEIDLKISEAISIGRELVDIVKQKSHATHAVVPITEDTLRASKGVTAKDVLHVLSLSADAYNILKKHEGQALLTLSRLHRLCKRSGVSENLISQFCELKAEWDVWYRTAQHEGDLIEFLSLRDECNKLLAAHAARAIDFPLLAKSAADLADKYRPQLTTSVPINKKLVLGHILALAAETGANL